MSCKSTRTALRAGIAILAMTVATLASSAPQFHGAIYTSVADGTTVNANLYDAKQDVYLNGGPQNLHAAGLPDGTYYFQITNPNGAVLLSTDPVVCRQLSVVNGAVSGATGPSCKHTNGIFNNANGSMPVQMIPFLDTPNNGGEYKAFLVSQDAGIGCGSDKVFAATDGIGLEFPLSCAKTDNFKVRKPLDANIVACKFNDLNGNGKQDDGEPTIAGWPITATGVADGVGLPNQTVATVTGADGCVAFTVPAASNVPVTLTEGTDANWYQTAPANGSYPASGTSPAYAVAGGAVSAVINGGQILDIDFGNRKALRVSKTARPSYKINWSIAKNVDNTEIKTSGSSAVFNYTVNVSHDTGSDFKVTGNITLDNDSPTAITGVNVSDAVDNGATSCVVTGGTGVTVPANGQVVVSYVCTYASLPAPGTNTATATWGVGGSSEGTVAVDFSTTVPSDASVTVIDTLVTGSLGTVTYTDASPKAFTYPITVPGTAGTCVTRDNTATFTTNTSATSGSASKTVKLCVGKDLTVAKDATPTFTRTYTWAISKDVDKTYIAQAGDTATFNYTVNASQTGLVDSGWQVTGTITVSNPNDWEDITVNVGDAINNGGTCTVSGGANLLVPKSSSATATYTCTYASAPSASAFTNTGTATWDSAAAYTPSGTASGTASGGFTAPTTTVDPVISVTDNYDSLTTTLGTLTATNAAPFAAQTFTYPRTVTGTAGTCVSKNNTATFTSTSSSTTGSSKTVTVKLCVGKDLTVSKSATATFTRTYAWDITKSVDNTYIAQAGDTATFNYTVVAKQTAVVDSGWLVTGTITVTNPNDWEAITVNVTDSINNGGTCTVTGGASLSVPASASATATYSCGYSSAPSSLAFTNTATATWNAAASATPTGTANGTFAGAFATPTTTVNPTINVTDTFDSVTTPLGTLTATNAQPFATSTFTYSHTVTTSPGTCRSVDNTATFRSTTTTGSASKSVRLCVGADLTVTKTASAAFTSVVAKGVDKTLVQQVGGGTATFTYTVNVTTSGWTVFGNITVANPNNWQSITANVSDALSDAGGVCTVAGGASVAVTASSSVTLAYTCSFASAPGANSGTNTATASWDGAAAATPNSSGAGGANYGFTAVTVKDTFNGGAPVTLGAVNAADGTKSYSYQHTVPVPLFNCQPYANLAAIDGGNSAPLVTVNVCGPAKTGALTKGFWQNKNGQGIIKAQTVGTCAAGTWLGGYAPFQDWATNGSTCAALALYVTNVIKAADASGTSMNPMLKAQMLATSLDVYFSDPALGGNKINAPAPIGGKNIDLTKICKDIGACTNYENVSSVFGPANNLTVYQMLLFAGSAPQSNYAGTNWYGQVKATQELAKDAFDAINNEKVFSP